MDLDAIAKAMLDVLARAGEVPEARCQRVAEETKKMDNKRAWAAICAAVPHHERRRVWDERKRLRRIWRDTEAWRYP